MLSSWAPCSPARFLSYLSCGLWYTELKWSNYLTRDSLLSSCVRFGLWDVKEHIQMHNTSTSTFILVGIAGEIIRLLKKTMPRTPVIARSPLTVSRLSFTARPHLIGQEMFIKCLELWNRRAMRKVASSEPILITLPLSAGEALKDIYFNVSPTCQGWEENGQCICIKRKSSNQNNSRLTSNLVDSHRFKHLLTLWLSSTFWRGNQDPENLEAE